MEGIGCPSTCFTHLSGSRFHYQRDPRNSKLSRREFQYRSKTSTVHLCIQVFFFSLYSQSSVAYDSFRHFIPVLCAKLLRKEFDNDIQEYTSDLCDIDAIAHIIAHQSLPAGIPCTLCVDAFSVDNFKSKSSTKRRRAGSEAICGLSV
jgi:hypothetical protein